MKRFVVLHKSKVLFKSIELFYSTNGLVSFVVEYIFTLEFIKQFNKVIKSYLILLFYSTLQRSI